MTGFLRKVGCALVASLILISFSGTLHPVGDSVAVFRLPLSMLAVLICLPARQVRARVMLVLALVCLATTFSWRPQIGGDITIYNRNLWAGNRQTAKVADEIKTLAPDFVLLQEVSDINRELLDKLAAHYPHRAFCRFSAWSGVAVLSRIAPEGPPRCTDVRGFAAFPVLIDGQKSWVVSTHLHLPWPIQDRGPIDDFADFLSNLDGAILLGGDFNMVPWGHSVRLLSKTAQVRRAVGSGPTFHLKDRLPVSIDHVFAPNGGRVERLGKLGSDHHGLLASVRLRP